MHGVEVGDVYGAEHLQGTAEHLLPQTGVDGEHGVVDMGVVALDVAEDGEEELLYLVGSGLHPLSVRPIGLRREIPVVAVSGMEQRGAVAQGKDGAHSHVGGTVGSEVEMRCVNALAKPQHGQRKAFVNTATAHSVVGGEEVPVGVRSAPARDVGIVVILVEMGNDEINRFALSLFEQPVQHPIRILPIVKDYQTVLLFGGKTGVKNKMQLHWLNPVRF